MLVQVMHGDMMNGDIVLIASDSALLRLTACMLREISSGDQLYRFYRLPCLASAMLSLSTIVICILVFTG